MNTTNIVRMIRVYTDINSRQRFTVTALISRDISGDSGYTELRLKLHGTRSPALLQRRIRAKCFVYTEKWIEINSECCCRTACASVKKRPRVCFCACTRPVMIKRKCSCRVSYNTWPNNHHRHPGYATKRERERGGGQRGEWPPYFIKTA